MSVSDHQKRPKFAGPLYSQVCDAIRERIIAQEWPPGRPFPNETELARDFAVSVGTMRKALGLLEQERLIVRQQGRGTFVADPVCDDELLPLPWLYTDGRSISLQITRRDVAPGRASAKEAGQLQIGEEDDVLRISRCHRNREDLAAIETLVVPAARFPGLGTENDPASPTLFSLYHRKFRVLVSSIHECVFVGEGADTPGHSEFADLAAAAHLCISRIAKDSNETPVEWSLLHVLDQDVQLVASRRRSVTKDRNPAGQSGRREL